MPLLLLAICVMALFALLLLLWPLALLFGALHRPQGGWGVVGTTLAAFALALLFLLTGGIWAPLAAHYVMNVTIRTGLAGEARPGERPGYFSSTSSAEAATGADLRSSNRGFGRTVEQMLLGILREYQNRGEEAHRPR